MVYLENNNLQQTDSFEMKVLIDTNIFSTVEGELILTLGDVGFRVRVKDLDPVTVAIHETNSAPIHPVGAMDSNEGGSRQEEI